MEFDWMLGLAHYLRANAYIEIDEIDNAKSDLLITSNMKFKNSSIFPKNMITPTANTDPGIA